MTRPRTPAAGCSSSPLSRSWCRGCSSPSRGADLSDPIKAVAYGIAIVGAAFLLSWAAEVVQLDFSQGLALALLALIAILPEYVVDATYAYLAAEDPAYAGYAVANMTGANRLLIGIAWPMVIAIGWLRFRRSMVVARDAARPGAGRAPGRDRLRVHDPVPGRDLAARLPRAREHVRVLHLARRAPARRGARTSSGRPSSSAR